MKTTKKNPTVYLICFIVIGILSGVSVANARQSGNRLAELVIYDLTGALIRQIPMDKPIQNINVSSLAPGVYQLSLFSAKNNTLTNKRFVKL